MMNDWRPKPNEEILLRWFFERNLQEAMKDRRTFNRFLNQQRKIRKYFGWRFVRRSPEDMLDDLYDALDNLDERGVFDWRLPEIESSE